MFIGPLLKLSNRVPEVGNVHGHDGAIFSLLCKAPDSFFVTVDMRTPQPYTTTSSFLIL
jgi:hypothetical protein